MHFPHAHRGSYFTVYRKGIWKLIYYYHPETSRPEVNFYNLKEDPFELKNMEKRRMRLCVFVHANDSEARGKRGLSSNKRSRTNVTTCFTGGVNNFLLY